MGRISHDFRKLTRSPEGAAAVEFAIILIPLLVLIVGIIDFGHMLMVKQVITNASREGARVGVVYPAPSPFAATITTAVKNYLDSAGVGPNVAGTPVSPTSPPVSGNNLTVTVTVNKDWFIIGYLIPGLGNHIQLTAEAVMRME